MRNTLSKRPRGGLPARLVIGLVLAAAGGAACAPAGPPEGANVTQSHPQPPPAKTQVATFGGGCFWCVEAVFQALDGVLAVESGYAGGAVEDPTYEQVCTGATGHAEVCQIRFDPAKVSYLDLLEVFWKTHDPTTLNRQGPDMGTQYRSVVFYHDDEQKTLAEQTKRKLNASGAWDRPIVTEISPFTKFYKADEYHQDYYRRNPRQAYCSAVIRPKMDKFRKAFAEKLKGKP